MILHKNMIAICLLAGVITPLHSQVKAQPQVGIMPHKIPVCPEGAVCINLCAVAHDMAPGDVSGDIHPIGKKKMQIETVEPRKTYSTVAHTDYKLNYFTKQEFRWTCIDPGTGAPQYFQITSIEKIRNPGGHNEPAVPDAPQFPFDPKLNPILFNPQEPGKALHSGPPVCKAMGQWYKFSFIAGNKNSKISPDGHAILNGTKIDPHFIVTPDPGGRYGNPHPCPPSHPGTNAGKGHPVSQ